MDIVSERINVPLSAEESHALIQLAEKEHRHPREQARLIIWRELKRRGMLASDPIIKTQSGSQDVASAI